MVIFIAIRTAISVVGGSTSTRCVSDWKILTKTSENLHFLAAASKGTMDDEEIRMFIRRCFILGLILTMRAAIG